MVGALARVVLTVAAAVRRVVATEAVSRVAGLRAVDHVGVLGARAKTPAPRASDRRGPRHHPPAATKSAAIAATSAIGTRASRDAAASPPSCFILSFSLLCFFVPLLVRALVRGSWGGATPRERRVALGARGNCQCVRRSTLSYLAGAGPARVRAPQAGKQAGSRALHTTGPIPP